MTQKPISDIPQGILLLELDASVMTNLEGLYREIVSVLKFPDYFGDNLDALDECINDLKWLPANSYLLVIKNSECLLKEEPDSILEGFLSILYDAGKEWAKPVKLGEYWDREAVPFHTILEFNKGNVSEFLPRLKRLGIEIQNL